MAPTRSSYHRRPNIITRDGRIGQSSTSGYSTRELFIHPIGRSGVYKYSNDNWICVIHAGSNQAVAVRD